MDKTKEFQTGGVKNKPRRKFGKWVFVSIFLLILCGLSFKPVRSQICDWTYICFYTCDTYSEEPVVITLNHSFSCEEIEVIRRNKIMKTILFWNKEDN